MVFGTLVGLVDLYTGLVLDDVSLLHCEPR